MPCIMNNPVGSATILQHGCLVESFNYGDYTTKAQLLYEIVPENMHQEAVENVEHVMLSCLML